MPRALSGQPHALIRSAVGMKSLPPLRQLELWAVGCRSEPDQGLQSRQGWGALSCGVPNWCTVME